MGARVSSRLLLRRQSPRVSALIEHVWEWRLPSARETQPQNVRRETPAIGALHHRTGARSMADAAAARRLERANTAPPLPHLPRSSRGERRQSPVSSQADRPLLATLYSPAASSQPLSRANVCETRAAARNRLIHPANPTPPNAAHVSTASKHSACRARPPCCRQQHSRGTPLCPEAEEVQVAHCVSVT